MQPEKSFGEAIIEELSEFADTLEDASMTVVAEDPEQITSACEMEIAGLRIRADSRCKKRAVLLVPEEVLGVLDALILDERDSIRIHLSGLAAYIEHLRNEIIRLTGVKI